MIGKCINTAMWKESNVQSASLSKAVLREKSVQGSSVSLPTCGSAVRESVFRPVAAEQRTHPRSGCTTLVKSVPVVERERESFAIRNNCAMIISIYLCIFVPILLLPQDVLLKIHKKRQISTFKSFSKMRFHHISAICYHKLVQHKYQFTKLTTASLK